MINFWNGKKRTSRQNLKTRNEELVVKNNPKSPVTEAFRSIRTNLEFISPDKKLKTVSITSSNAAEGKSLVLANLAVSLAQNGEKVIVVDADMRKPMLHKFFDLTNFVGLSNVLLEKSCIEESLRETEVGGVRLLSSGFVPPNPAELLASRKMRKVLEELAAAGDRILIDTPPVLPVADSSIVASLVDGVLLIVASRDTDEQALSMAQNNLERVQANIVGTILNRYDIGGNGNYGKYYHYSYYSSNDKAE